MNQYKIKFLEDKLIDYIGFAPKVVMDHLVGTAVILKEYGAPDYLVDAGLFHSIYGEESSRNVPKNIYLTREELVESAKKVFDAVLSEKFKVEIFKKYSLSDAKKAHEDLEARLLTGPAVIIPN